MNTVRQNSSVSLLAALVFLGIAGCPSALPSGGVPGELASDGTSGAEEAPHGSIDPDASELSPPSLDDSGTGDALDPEGDEDLGDVHLPEIQSGTLTAGSFDDNLNYDVFLQFLAEVGQSALAGLPELFPGERVIIRVTGDSGRPVGGANVQIATQDQNGEFFEVVTGTDGRALFLTGVDLRSSSEHFLVTVFPPDGSEPVESSRDGSTPLWEIALPAPAGRLPSRLDLAFVVDATGSMSDELEYLKAEIHGFAAAVSREYPEVRQRFALVVYRDEADLYVTRTFDFTASLNEFRGSLAQQFAAGGGDYPEAMHLALEEAEQLSWSFEESARVLFLVADAPPHASFALRALESIDHLRRDGIALYPVAASGVALEAEFIMRTAALLTLSQYLFLTDDSGIGNPHAEPHIPCYEVQRLDTLMIRMIETELAGRRINPLPEQIIRTVGNPVNGVCMDGIVPGQEQP